MATLFKDTEIIVAGDPETVGLKWRHEVFDKNIAAALKGESFISETIQSPATKRPIMLITIPIELDGNIMGILGLSVMVNELNKNLLDIKIGESGYVILTDTKGQVILHPERDLILNLNLNDTEFGKKLYASESGTIIRYEWNGKKKALLGLKNDQYQYWILAALEISDIEKEANSILLLIGISSAIFLVISITVLLWYLHLRFKPLQKAVEAANKISIGNMDVDLTVIHNDEIGALTKAMKQMIEGMQSRISLIESITEGDLTQKMEIQSDKDTMSISLNKMVDNLSSMMMQIDSNSKSLVDSSTDLSAVSTQLASGSEEMQAQSATVAGTTEEMATNMTGIAATTNQISNSIDSVSSDSKEISSNMNKVSSSVEEMSHAIKEIAEFAGKGSQISNQAMTLADTASSKMATLGEKAKEVDEVTEIIKEIASKTNLLALNANIEAASAGEAGKGFAVVANEIKDLAKQSVQAAQVISERITDVQNNTTGAVDVITKVADIISQIDQSVVEITESVNRQEHTTEKITTNVQNATISIENISDSISEVAKGVGEISNSVKEAAVGTRQVSSNIHGVTTAAADASSSSRQVNASSKALAKIANQLKELVSSFNLNDIT